VAKNFYFYSKFTMPDIDQSLYLVVFPTLISPETLIIPDKQLLKIVEIFNFIGNIPDLFRLTLI
jgi:hypothetical protein